MGRAPCCDKASVKKGPWSPEEDAVLKDYIEKHGTGGNWIALPQKAGLRRCGKSCRLRWLNYLRPNIKHGNFTDFEDRVICTLYSSIGSRWSVIAAQLPGRTDNDIKNYWNTKLKKKLMASQASGFFLSQMPHLINSYTHHIPPPPPPSLLSSSFPLPPALQSPPAHKINFESPLQHYQVKRGGSSIAYGGGGAGAGGQAACSLPEGNYNAVSETGTVSGTNSDRSPSCDYHPYQGVEEKENSANTSSGGGGGWTQKSFAGKTWGENAILADYGFEEFKQLISSDNCSFLFDEDKDAESVYY